MANNPRFTPSNKGKSAIGHTKEAVGARRANPAVPHAPEEHHAGIRTRDAITQGKQTRAQGGGGAGPVPAERNAVDRTIARMAEAKKARANKGK